MFSGLQEDQLKGALEAMLFVTDEPVGTIALADMLEVEPAEVERALVDLRAQLEEENRGIQLREVAGGWRLAPTTNSSSATCCHGTRGSFRRQPWRRWPSSLTRSRSRAPAWPACAA